MLQSSPSTLAFETATPAAGFSARLARLSDRAIFLFFILFAILLPFSIKGAQHAWKLAFLIWLAKLVIQRKRPLPVPLYLLLPLTTYVLLSGISTALSPDPTLSWDRMKVVCLVLVGLLFAANLRSIAKVRILVVLLLLAGLAAAGFTAWQYTYGVGVQVQQLNPAAPLRARGIRRGDIVTSVNGRQVHTPSQLEHVLGQSTIGTPLQLNYLHGYPLQRLKTTATREDFAASGLGSPALRLERGRPFRAQGTLGHYIVFAEMLMQLACLAWALLLAASATPPTKRSRALIALYAAIFIAITAALFATETRAAFAGLALGCFISLLMLAGPRLRILGITALALLVVAATASLYHTRHVDWIDPSDAGTNFRMLMWEDGLRLVRQHPWFGVGMETVRTHWREWNIRGFALYHVVSHFHSTFLQIAVERGLTTLAAWLWFVVAYLVFLFRLVRKAKPLGGMAAGVAAGVLAAFIAFISTSFVHYNLGEEPLVMILFFYLGLAVALDRIVTPAAHVEDIGS